MKKKLYLLPFLVIFAVFLSFPEAVSAASNLETTTQSDNTSITHSKNGFITRNGNTYYYKNNKKRKGFQKIEGKTYYFDKKGIMLTGRQKIKGKTYYFNKKGIMLTGFRKINKKTYYFNKKGIMQTGFETVKNSTYYFNSKGVMLTGFRTIKRKQYYFADNGVMQTGLKKIGGKTYYFNKKGMMQTGFQTVNRKKYYFNEKGVMQKGLKRINRKYYYFSNKGVMQTGFLELNHTTYYFDTKTGARYTPKKDGTVKKINNIYAVFNKDGSYRKEASYVLVKGAKMHVQYYSDPQVSTEKLLAAILYAEAGNQRDFPVKAKLGKEQITLYKGHLSVGYVIANRMNSSLGLKEVVYQLYQFQPARTGVLTHYLENYHLVSKECKNAARVILNDLNKNTNSVPDFKRSDFTWKNFWAVGYARTTNFFRVYTPKEYYILQGHVFFNFTKMVN